MSEGIQNAGVLHLLLCKQAGFPVSLLLPVKYINNFQQFWLIGSLLFFSLVTL